VDGKHGPQYEIELAELIRWRDDPNRRKGKPRKVNISSTLDN
jgi:hypothetical protein